MKKNTHWSKSFFNTQTDEKTNVTYIPCFILLSRIYYDIYIIIFSWDFDTLYSDHGHEMKLKKLVV
jgi:hypothetical protein